MEFCFLPALGNTATRWAPVGIASSQYIGKPSKTRSPLQNLKLNNWMDEELRGTEGYYPHVLVSYYYFRNLAMALPKEGFVLGDSGGFSVLRYGMSRTSGAPHQRRVDATDVLRWQAEMCTVGLILDKPPVNLMGTRIWEDSFAVTMRNVRKALPLYEQMRKEGLPFRWWGVAHGWTEPHLDEWWKALSDIYPFSDAGEGCAVRARPVSYDPVNVARRLKWLQRNKIKRTHFLAAASPLAAATIVVLGPRAGLKFVSSDSLAGTIHGTNRSIVLTAKDGLGYREIEEKADERFARDYLLNKCPCFSCDQLRVDITTHPQHVAGKYNEYWTHRFVYHNLLTIFKMFKNITEEGTAHPDELLKEVLGPVYSNVLRAFDGTEPQTTEVGMPKSLLDYL